MNNHYIHQKNELNWKEDSIDCYSISIDRFVKDLMLESEKKKEQK